MTGCASFNLCKSSGEFERRIRAAKRMTSRARRARAHPGHRNGRPAAQTPSLIRPELGAAASGGWPQIAQRICFAFLEFGVAFMGLQVSRPNRVMADRAHLSGFTISAASGNGLRHVAQSKSQRYRSNNDYLGRPSPGACLCQPGFLFSCEFQLKDREPARTFRRFLGGRRRHLF